MAFDPESPSNISGREENPKCPFQFNVFELSCNSTFDGISCWPSTRASHVAVISCFAELNTIKYNATGNATRICLPNGVWANSNYTMCVPIRDDAVIGQITEADWETPQIIKIIYIIGYSLSLVALVIALSILLSLKDLRCHKNTFHIHLMFTYVLVICTWILTLVSPILLPRNKSCTCILVILFHYCIATNFFWMFVEAFYLFLLVVMTYTVEKVKFYYYVLIGWGAPAVVVGVWVVVKAQLVGEDLHDRPILEDTETGCPWLEAHNYDFVFIGPILFIVAINVLFLIIIMWVLITKLRVTTSVESQQYRKAAKALLVLIPLLGVTYIFVIQSPSGTAFVCIRAILISTQGFAVAVLYCFMNGEVRSSIRHHWDRWQDSRSVGCPSRHSTRRKGSVSGVGKGSASPGHPGECQRLYDNSVADSHRHTFSINDPESCVSTKTDIDVVVMNTNGFSHSNKLSGTHSESMNLKVDEL